tara:strand:+ start:19696 stop:20157 length:462 start_codon:yes stop_codon:yes gene_type:complete
MMQYLQMAGTALSIYSSLSEGRDEVGQEKFQQQQLTQKMEQDKINARKESNARLRTLDSHESMNRAFVLGKLNRDVSDRSLKAFLQRQRDIGNQDVQEIQTQSILTQGQDNARMQYSSLRAQNAYTGALLGAGSSVASGMFRYQQYKVDGYFD